MLPDTTPLALLEGAEVVFPGLFANFTGTERNVPAMRFGNIALVTSEPIEGEYGPADQFLVECQAYPGNSGAPLFVLLTPQSTGQKTFFMIGVVTGFYPEKQYVQTTKGEVRLYTHFGISGVTPIRKLREIIYGEAELKAHDEVIGVDRKKKTQEPVSLDADGDIFTREEFEKSHQKVGRKRVKPPRPDSSSSGT